MITKSNYSKEFNATNCPSIYQKGTIYVPSTFPTFSCNRGQEASSSFRYSIGEKVEIYACNLFFNTPPLRNPGLRIWIRMF